MKEKYINFSVDELSSEDPFIAWVLESSELQPNEWYVEGNDVHNKKVDEAKYLVLAIHGAKPDNQQSDVNDVWKRIESSMNVEKETRNTRSLWKYLSGVAAILLVVVGAYLFTTTNSDWVTVKNTAQIDQKIQLEDQSSIVLKPNSSVKYRKDFMNSREVELVGEAFFDVTKDANNPFLIYAQSTVTKVLGTSFNISAFEEKEQVLVDVYTGKVEVYSVKDRGLQNHTLTLDRESKKVLLTPNQKAIFNKNKKALEKTVMTVPRKLSTTIQSSKFVNSPLEVVFAELENIYGIKIDFDKNLLSNCTISTELDDLPLPIKMEMITNALGLSLTEKNAIFYVKGDSCK